MIKTNNLTYAYSEEVQFSFPDIVLEQGQPLLLLGASGVGKTTLMHLLAGLLPPKSGSITISGSDITKLSGKKLDKFRGDQIGLIFQKPLFVSSLSVLENLKLKQFFNSKEQKARNMELLERLNIAEVANQKTFEISEGQKQRLSIALALVNNPSIIMADEPTASLDDANCENVLNLLKEESKANQSSLLIITHDQRAKQAFTNSIAL